MTVIVDGHIDIHHMQEIILGGGFEETRAALNEVVKRRQEIASSLVVLRDAPRTEQSWERRQAAIKAQHACDLDIRQLRIRLDTLRSEVARLPTAKEQREKADATRHKQWCVMYVGATEAYEQISEGLRVGDELLRLFEYEKCLFVIWRSAV